MLIHFSHDLSSQSSPSYYSTFHIFLGIPDLLSEVTYTDVTEKYNIPIFIMQCK